MQNIFLSHSPLLNFLDASKVIEYQQISSFAIKMCDTGRGMINMIKLKMTNVINLNGKSHEVWENFLYNPVTCY